MRKNRESKTKHGAFFRKNMAPLAMIILAAVLLVCSIVSRPFSDFYRAHIFPVWVESYGRLTGVLPFSFGCFLLYLGVFLVAVLVLWGIGLLLCGVVRVLAGKKKSSEAGKPAEVERSAEADKQTAGGARRGAVYAYAKYATVILWIAGCVSLIMVLNCFILYHTTPFSSRYYPPQRKYTVEELGILRDYIVEQANDLSDDFARDAQGRLPATEEVYRESARQAVMDMKRLGETYPELGGYYPLPKLLWPSWFYSQQYILGYYFPFSMEANVNPDMYLTNLPVTLCHELSHLKGNIYEDQANFIGYLACESSESPLSRYSAYLSVINYVERDFKASIGGADTDAYLSHPQICEQVQEDRIFLTPETWEEVEAKSPFPTETVHQATNTFLQTNLTVNGVESGIASYGEVVGRLLEYYDGILY